MSYSSISQNFVEKSFFFLELFQKNMRVGYFDPPLRFFRVNRHRHYLLMRLSLKLRKQRVFSAILEGHIDLESSEPWHESCSPCLLCMNQLKGCPSCR